MEEFEKILLINKKLDEEFDKRYSDDKDYYKKNCIALVVEFGEFINETKCFKYWSIKPSIKEKVLEEYADCITMCLSFFTYFNVTLEYTKEHYNVDDVFILINKIFSDITNMMDFGNEELIKIIFSNLLYLGELLKLDKEEIYDACYKKMGIIDNRLNSDY